jgi:hypothetical protein
VNHRKPKEQICVFEKKKRSYASMSSASKDGVHLVQDDINTVLWSRTNSEYNDDRHHAKNTT